MARGDDRALAELYDRYGGLVYSLAYRILGDAADAEETTADAFIQVWSSVASFDASRGSIASWISMIARSRALDRLRARRRRTSVVETAAREGGPGFAPAAGAAEAVADRGTELDELRTRVARELAQLPEAQRQAIELAFFEGLSHSEIAERLREPLGTVKTRIRTGMGRLRASLASFPAVE